MTLSRPKPYSIWLPNLDITSGGIRVLYGLVGWLLAKGQVVIPNVESKNFITIYPEIVHGNPFGAEKVVRYILAEPGVMGMGGKPGPTEFDKSESIYIFSQLYNSMGIDDERVLFLPILDLHTFKVTNTGKRKYRCKIVGKGIDQHLPETEGLFELTREFSNDQGQLADYLNECEVMYTYDPNTAMTEIARLCGCRVVIIPSRYTREEYLKYEPGMNGISWGIKEEIPLEVDAFRDHYKNLIYKFDMMIDKFIEETQQND